MHLDLPTSLTRGLSTHRTSNRSATVNAEGLHLLMCDKGSGYVFLHDSMFRAFHSLKFFNCLKVMVEQRGIYPNRKGYLS